MQGNNAPPTFPVLTDTIVEIEIANPSFEAPNYLNISIGIRSNIDGLEFAKGELSLSYPTSVLGTNIAQSQGITAFAAPAFPNSIYNLSLADHPSQNDVLLAAIGSDCDDKPQNQVGTSLSSAFQPFSLS